MSDHYSAAILGGSGFVGSELYRLLAQHPNFIVNYVSSESLQGQFVERYYKNFRYGGHNAKLKFSSIKDLKADYDVIFSCLPTGTLPGHIGHLLSHCRYLFNVSGDYRFEDKQTNERYYPNSISTLSGEHKAHYFIPEISELVAEAKIINLPGCMAVAAIYSLYPLVKHQLVKAEIVVDAKTGSTGGGRKSKEMHAEREANFRLFQALSHRHVAEIEKLSSYSARPLDVSFSANSLPMARGIYINAYSYLNDGVTEVDVRKAFVSEYKNARYIHYLKSRQVPMLKTVNLSNNVEVATFTQGQKCLSVVALDNLMKGAAGQAVQAANLYLGLDESTGLSGFDLPRWP